jgi:hypothetical protein
MLQCQPAVCVRSSVIVWVCPAGNGVFELPSSSVNVWSVESLFVTVRVTFPELTLTEFGSNAKFAAVMVAVEVPPPPPAGADGVLAVLDVLELLPLEHPAAVSTTATSSSPAIRGPLTSSPSPGTLVRAHRSRKPQGCDRHLFCGQTRIAPARLGVAEQTRAASLECGARTLDA